MTASDQLETPWGQLTVRRWPAARVELLQAWDGADRLFMSFCDQEALPDSCWVVNEHWGALSIGLRMAGVRTAALLDSYCHKRGVLENAAASGQLPPECEWLFSSPDVPPQRVLLHIPKDMALLTWQLQWLRQTCPAETSIWLAGLDKHLPRTTRDLLDQHVAGLISEPGRFKAHLFRGVLRPGAKAEWPWRTQQRVDVDEPLWTLPGVFAASGIDPGGRYLIEHLPEAQPQGLSVDLGCGSGMVGIALKTRFPDAPIVFADDSWLAVSACGRNVEEQGWPEDGVQVVHTDGLRGVEQHVALVLLNPPFHSGHALDTAVARRLIRHAARQLVAGGELRMVCNRHLDHRRLLERHFSGYQQLAENKQFRVISAFKG